MELKRLLTDQLRKTSLFATARDIYVSLSPKLRAQREIETEDLKKLASEVGTILQQPLYSESKKIKKVLIMGMGRVPYIAQETVIRKAFEMAGYRPIVLIPQDNLIIKTYNLLGTEHVAFLDRYLSKRSNEAQKYLKKNLTLDDVVALDFNGVRCGKYAASTLMRKVRSGSFDFSDAEIKHALEKALNRSFECKAAADALLEDIRPEALVLVDRGYSPSGELFDTCVERNIPVFTWNVAHKNNSLMLKRYDLTNRDVHPSSLSKESWEALKQMKWTTQHWEMLKSELEMCYKTGQWYAEVGTQFNKKSLSKAQLIERLGVDPNKKTAVIFPHIFWDATFFWGKDLFENYENWFVETVKAACLNDRLNWVIKVHPANLVKNKRDGVTGEHSEIAAIRKSIGTLPAHVKVLPADTDINTLSLFSFMDCCVTVRGTVGIEAACFGVPVLTAGTGRFDGLGFTLDSHTREEYLGKLTSVEKLERMDDYQTELARRYAYGVLMCRPADLHMLEMKFQLNDTADLSVNFKVDSLEKLKSSVDVKTISEWISSGTEDYMQDNQITNQIVYSHPEQLVNAG